MGNVYPIVGNMYARLEKPPRKGDSPFTRSGVPPPKMAKVSGSDAPSHRIHDPMRLELHMGDDRMRAAGMSKAEREWRKTWLKDQHIHPDEPVHVDAVYRQLNPVRILYRWPWDKLYLHFLRPTFGLYWGGVIRILVPKCMMTIVFFQIVYYMWKYESKDWQRIGGVLTYPDKMSITKKEEIEARHPGATTLGVLHPREKKWAYPTFHHRYALLDVGESKRPW